MSRSMQRRVAIQKGQPMPTFSRTWQWFCRCGAQGGPFSEKRAAERDGDGHVLALCESEPNQHLTEVR